MTKKLQAIRGMNDILPEKIAYWHRLEAEIQRLCGAFNYTEIRMPLVEVTDLFQRSIGEVTDIVEKEMYTFNDRNGDSLTLRPEGTAGCVRAVLQHSLINNQPQRLWYYGPMYRYERPQKGRYRQFYQLGLEAFGFVGPDIDLELIMYCDALWRALGIRDKVELQLNSLGTAAARAEHRKLLVEYFRANYAQLDADSQRRLEQNPLRILDSKNPEMQQLNNNAPKITECLDAESQQHFQQLCGWLDDLDIAYTINPRLVRGLDYYSRTVFEWVTDSLGAQNTVCGGGRYDALVEELGGAATPAIGFSMGAERVLELMSMQVSAADVSVNPHAFMVIVGEKALTAGFAVAKLLRDQIPNLRLCVNMNGGNFKTQFKRADKSGAQLAIILGEDEIQRGEISVKFLRVEQPQQTFNTATLTEFLQTFTHS